MVQKYLPEIVGRQARCCSSAASRCPLPGAHPAGQRVRGNLAAGGKGVAQPLTARDRQHRRGPGPVLAARGLLLVGLDVIGDSLTEINVTSPTCFRGDHASRPASTWRACSSTRWRPRWRAARRSGPGEVLEFVPGVIVTQHSGDGKANQYFLRGFNLDHGTDFATRLATACR
jgi:hypothetical protein